jgi:hypothetical protein
LRLLSMLKEELQDSDITSYKIGTISLLICRSYMYLHSEN